MLASAKTYTWVPGQERYRNIQCHLMPEAQHIPAGNLRERRQLENHELIDFCKNDLFWEAMENLQHYRGLEPAPAVSLLLYFERFTNKPLIRRNRGPYQGF
jgi:hypothetical protein